MARWLCHSALGLASILTPKLSLVTEFELLAHWDAVTDKISFRVRLLAVPLSRSIQSPSYRFTDFFTILLQARADDGATGWSGLWFTNAEQAKVVLAALRYLAPTAGIGAEPGLAAAALRRESNLLGYKGVMVIAMSGLEMGLTDLQLRRSGLSLGGTPRRARVPAYWSGFFLNDSLESWATEAQLAVSRGFGAFKARLGRATVAEDVARVATLRDALPPDAILMLDPNQAWGVDTALEAARLLSQYNVKWLEDPIVHNDYSGLARIVRESPIAIAAGENEYLHEGFEQLMDAGIRYLLADLERAGGFGEWNAIAATARSRGATLTPHLYPQVAVRLCAVLEQDETWVEYLDWWDPLMAQHLELSDGQLVVPTTPGTGFEPDPDAIERFALAGWEELPDVPP